MTKQISPLRQRMLDDMAFRNMSPSTQKCYTYAVACFAQYHQHLARQARHRACPTVPLAPPVPRPQDAFDQPIVGALRFFYCTTLDNNALADQIGYARPEDTLPAVLTGAALIKAEPDLMMRTISITIYAAGLRMSEVIRLTASDINSQRDCARLRSACLFTEPSPPIRPSEGLCASTTSKAKAPPKRGSPFIIA